LANKTVTALPMLQNNDYKVQHKQLTYWKMRGFHGGDYEECRLLEYKTPVRTSQETHYVSAAEPSR
jgi:hypothetical protein